MTRLETTTLSADSLPGDTVVALYFSDQRPVAGPAALLDWRLDGQLTSLLLSGAIKGKAGEHLLLQNNGKLKADWALFVGGGKWQGLSTETYAALLTHALDVTRQAGFKNISLCLAPHEDADATVLREQVRTALRLQHDEMRSCWLSCEPLDSSATL